MGATWLGKHFLADRCVLTDAFMPAYTRHLLRPRQRTLLLGVGSNIWSAKVLRVAIS
jgi:hypothetical protein